MTQIINSWDLFLQSQNKTDYIPKDIKEISQLGYLKKKRALKAIWWLLSKAPHSVDELADHFEISHELAKGLIEELAKANLVVKVPGRLAKYYIQPIEFNVEVVHKSLCQK